MPHSLIVGQTESGKTTLCKQIISLNRKAGIKSIILDPMNDPGWEADFRTRDTDAFLKMVWGSERCNVVVDEAGKMIGRYDDVMEELATMGRQWGHNCYFITQRPAQLSLTIRTQCRHVFIFNSGFKDCKTLSEDFNRPELMQAVTLPQGHFLHVTRFGALERGQLWE